MALHHHIEMGDRIMELNEIMEKYSCSKAEARTLKKSLDAIEKAKADILTTRQEIKKRKSSEKDDNAKFKKECLKRRAEIEKWFAAADAKKNK